MDFTKLDERIDLDNYLTEVVTEYPKTEDEFIFFIRGKISTKEFFVATSGEEYHFAYALFNLSLQSDIVKEGLYSAVEQLKKDEQLNK